MNKKSILRRTAAEVLAAAVFETFPKVTYLGGSDDRFAFSYDFIFPHAVHPELHLQLEEKMRQIAREKREIRSVEMMGVSAKELLKSKGLFSQAEKIEGKGLFSLIWIDGFVDVFEGAAASNTAEFAHVKLFPPTIEADGVLRISGMVASSKEELKEMAKKWSQYPQKRHEKKGEVELYWTWLEERLVILPKGMEEMRRHIQLWKEKIVPAPREIRSFDPALHASILALGKEPSLCEVFFEQGNLEVGCFDPGIGTWLQITTSLKNANSFLQSIRETLTMLGFSYRVCLSSAKRHVKEASILEPILKQLLWPYEKEIGEEALLSFFVQDALGREWKCAEIKAKEVLSLHILVERNLALLLEMR